MSATFYYTNNNKIILKYLFNIKLYFLNVFNKNNCKYIPKVK